MILGLCQPLMYFVLLLILCSYITHTLYFKFQNNDLTTLVLGMSVDKTRHTSSPGISLPSFLTDSLTWDLDWGFTLAE